MAKTDDDLDKILDIKVNHALELAARMERGLPPRSEQEAKDMEEAKALIALFDAFIQAPQGASGEQIKDDIAEAARARIFGNRN
jgi:hypothetical protein